MVEEQGRRATRGPVPEYSRQQLAAAALEIADAEGLAAVSMRRVAAAIGAAPASLYRYVENRDQLLGLMADAVLGGLDLPADPSGQGWEADILVVARGLRELYRAHPWLLDLTPGPAVLLGSGAATLLESAVAALSELDLPGTVALEAVAMLIGVVGLFVRDEVAGGQATPQVQAESAAKLGQLIASGRYPHLAHAVSRPPAREHDPAGVFDRIVLNVMRGLTGI